jgi:xylan 1,4-beta-xylosidase
VSGFCPHSSQAISLGVIGLFLCITFAPSLVFAQDAVTIRVDAGASRLSLKPIWSYFGYDEPNYTYMKRGQSLIAELSALSPEPVYLRAHNLLTSGDATPALKWGSTKAYTEDPSGRLIYNTMPQF